MWYGVQTAFVDGKLLDSKICFEEGNRVKGLCYARHDEEPMNTCLKEFDDRIEIHNDWFETAELAMQFSAGKITYKHIYQVYYDKGIKSERSKFCKREIVQVNPEAGIMPHRGIKEKIYLDYRPFWAER